MNRILQITQLAFLLTAVWQDIGKRSIAIWVYAVFGLGALLVKGCIMGGDFVLWSEMGESMAVGGVICVISKVTRGAVGIGDGWFFVITGIYLGLRDNIALFFYGLMLCGIFSVGMVLWGAVMNVNVSKKRLPFLPFLLAPGIWMVML